MVLDDEIIRDKQRHVMDYPSIAKEKCESMIEGRICPSCGGKLEALSTRDNAGNPTWWSGCNPCQRFSWGVDPIVFKVAKEMVDNHNYKPYSHLGVKENHPKEFWPEWYRSQYSGACSDICQILKIANNLSTIS